jgi:hypothetical protein
LGLIGGSSRPFRDRQLFFFILRLEKAVEGLGGDGVSLPPGVWALGPSIIKSPAWPEGDLKVIVSDFWDWWFISSLLCKIWRLFYHLLGGHFFPMYVEHLNAERSHAAL